MLADIQDILKPFQPIVVNVKYWNRNRNGDWMLFDD